MMRSWSALADRGRNTLKHRSRWLGGIAAVAFALMGVATAAGYAGSVPGSVEITVGSVNCNQPVVVTATVLDTAGQAIPGQMVEWTLTSTPSSADAISPSSSTTDASGVATTSLTLSCIPGNRQLRATADQVSGTAVIALPQGGTLGSTGGPGQGGNGLPNTTTAPADAAPGPGLFLVLLAILAVLVGAGVTVRRLAAARR